MEGTQFDRLTRVLGQRLPRRSAVAVLAAAAGTGAAGASARGHRRKGVSASAVTTQEIDENFAMSVFVECANGGQGEVVDISGRLHIVCRETANADGGGTFGCHYQPQGVKGVGTVTGTKYQATGVTQDTITFTLEKGQTYSYINNFRMIGQGRGNNYLVHQNYHVTYNADGTLTAEVDNYRVDCK